MPSNPGFASYGGLLCAQLLAAWVFIVLARAESGRPAGVHDVPCVVQPTARKLSIVFVDSLSERVAHDREVMPELSRLAKRGVSLEITPCRDQLSRRRSSTATLCGPRVPRS